MQREGTTVFLGEPAGKEKKGWLWLWKGIPGRESATISTEMDLDCTETVHINRVTDSTLKRFKQVYMGNVIQIVKCLM